MATVEVDTNLDSSLRENRVFPPPAEFAANAHIKSLAEKKSTHDIAIGKSDGSPHRFINEFCFVVCLVLGSKTF